MKPIPGREELFAQLKALAPEKDWDTVDEDWETQMEYVLAARPRVNVGREDRLYAQIVACEGTSYEDYGWAVRSLFQIRDEGLLLALRPQGATLG